MSKIDSSALVETTGTALTRFNALRHGVLSRYTVLPWEDPEEYQALVAALVAEHAPQGPTEEHLVEELAGILWRKRPIAPCRSRRPPARARRHLCLLPQDSEGGARPSRRPRGSERVTDAIRATDSDTEEDMRELEEDEAMTRRALDLLDSLRNDRYEAALAALREDTREWWADMLARHRRQNKATNPPLPMKRACGASWRARCCPGTRPGEWNSPTVR